MFKHTRTFSSFSASDLNAVQTFYSQVLGLQVTKGEMGVLSLHLDNGYEVMIYPKPNHTPATFTVLNLVVEDIDSAVADLKAKGVKFEMYDMPDLKTDENGIMRDGGPLIAWFKDPSENIISVLQVP
jgi:predicted enzyme related to lactoylglutathione lyase